MFRSFEHLDFDIVSDFEFKNDRGNEGIGASDFIIYHMVQTITLHPSRIGCPSLPGTMKGIVMSLPGVSAVDVRYTERALDVTFDPALTTPETIVKTISDELGLAIEVGEDRSSRDGSVEETCPM